MIERWGRGLGVWTAWLGTGLLLVTAVWWWLVFRVLILSANLPVPQALPCMVDDSTVCRLAQALCTADHFLGIRRYDTQAFWISATLLAAGLIVRRLAPARHMRRAAQEES